MKKENAQIVKADEQSLEETANLYERVREILESAKQNVARSVNSEMVKAYWLIGQAIVEQEQRRLR